MSENERSRVGQALDAIRDALTAYIDEAMVGAYGQDWDDAVATDDAKRRRVGRKWPVAKSDLAVMLRVLTYWRIEPWSSLRTYPRIRAFASEVLTLRNLHAHGDECVGEHARLVDTGNRILVMLGLEVPPGLEPLDREPAALPTGFEVSPVGQRPPPALSRLDVEVAGLGEAGERLAEMVVRATELSRAVHDGFHGALRALDPGDPDWETFKREYIEICEPIGAEVLELLGAVEFLEARQSESTDPVLEVLIFATRCYLLDPTLEVAAELHTLTLEAQQHERRIAEITRLAERIESSRTEGEPLPSFDHPKLEAMERRVEEARRLLDFGGSDDERSRELIRVASGIEDAHPFANVFIAQASVDLAVASRGGGDPVEALAHVRDAIVRIRFEAGMEPGSGFEATLIRLLRFEGEICSDLGQTDEAIEAFARAREIVDRYPAADPALGS